MDEHNHQKLRRLFDLAISKPPDDRADFLDIECADDVVLRQRLEAMIAAAEGDEFLNAPTAAIMSGEMLDATIGLPSGVSVAPRSEGPGTIIGPYRLLELLGEGGFGSVYMAEQRVPVDRRVALKIIKLGMDTRQIVARFEAERQALAMMDHPNIAKVFDAGATETGRPFFVMDLVKGEPIAKFCDSRGLGIEDRLLLFEQVCRAVQHAHTKGVIHRDLKPSNILVSMQDGRPVARVIDFGIAKATQSRLTEKTLFTEHHQLIGTPEYMSPEQAEGDLDIDTRSDVFALGVLLYELLTGTTPIPAKSLRSAAFGEMQRMIREVDPPKPSTRLSQSGDGIAAVAAARRTAPDRLRAVVLGELDWIVMKALEKDRARRYETASGLATDVGRYLRGETVLAAPPSRTYQLRKFVRRQKGPVAAAFGVAAALVAGAVAFGWQASVATHQRDIAMQAERSEATARARAESIGAFVVAALNSSDPYAIDGRQSTTVLEAMRRAVNDLESGRFTDDPETEAQLRQIIGVILLNNGGGSEGESLIRQSLEILEFMGFADDPRIVEGLVNLAAALQEVGREVEADALATRALDIATRLSPEGDLHLADTMLTVASSRQRLGLLEEAERLVSESLTLQERLGETAGLRYVESLSLLASILFELGRPEEAEAPISKAIQIYDVLYPGDRPQKAETIAVRSAILRDLRRLDEAERDASEALAIQQRMFQGDHPAVASAMLNLGSMRRTLGRDADAEPLYERALEMSQRLYPGDHQDTAMVLNNLASLRRALGRPDEAETLFLESLNMRRRLYPGDHTDIAVSLSNLAQTLESLGRSAEAAGLLQEAVDMNRRLFRLDHPNVVISLASLARVQQSLGLLDEAMQNAGTALEIQRRLTPDGSTILARLLVIVGQLQMETLGAAAALPLLQEALQIAERVYPPGHPALRSFIEALEACEAEGMR